MMCEKKIYILGISGLYHDSAAAIICNGVIVAAAQEERFTRKKHDSSFPTKAVEYCLKEAGINLEHVSEVVFYDKPLLKFERLLETYLAYAPVGITSFVTSMPVWLKEKLFFRSLIKKELSIIDGVAQKKIPPILFTEHHESHAASAFFPSPFTKAAVLCVDGVGEWATTTVWRGNGNMLKLEWEIDFPHSLGLLYSAFTYYAGFKVNSGEYKLMGLAPYGDPVYVDTILNHLIDLKEDGTFRLNMKYFNFPAGLTMTNKAFNELFAGPPRAPEGILTKKEMDIASSIQQVTEEVMLRLCRTIRKETGEEYLCLAGGVALNCVANGKILREGIFKDIYIQPAAGDAGGSLGAALSVWHKKYLGVRCDSPGIDRMKGSYLGPSYTNEEIETYLQSVNAKYIRMDDNSKLCDKVAELLDSGKVVGWFNGRMEFGPRALGRRSIIGDARNSEMQKIMNLKIKFRESFRPFAPAVLAEDVSNYFDLNHSSPYMLLVATVKQSLRKLMTESQQALFGIEKLNVARSIVPAVTHVDYSARVQTVHGDTNEQFHRLLMAFKKRTGCSVLVNTSFNVRGEPIVCTPEDAYRCFMRTGIDCLVMENVLLMKIDQPDYGELSSWQKEYLLD